MSQILRKLQNGRKISTHFAKYAQKCVKIPTAWGKYFVKIWYVNYVKLCDA